MNDLLQDDVMRCLFEESNDAIFVFDTDDHRILDLNPGAQRLTCSSRERLLGKKITDVLIAEESRATEQLPITDKTNGGFHSQEGYCLQVEGNYVLSVNLSLHFSQADSKILGYVVARDVTGRRQTDRVLRMIEEGTFLSFDENYFRALVRYLANSLEIRCAFVSEIQEQDKGKLRLLANWIGEEYGENYVYNALGTPCEQVMEKGLVCYPENVQKHFPEDKWLADHHFESYLAIPLFDLEGKPIGHLGVADDKPILEPASAESILQIVSTRAGAELLRMQTEKELQKSRDELEDRVKLRTADLQKANKQLEEETAERRSLTRIYRSSPIGLCCFDTNLRFIDVNEWLAMLNGIPVEEHLGKTISEVIPDVAAGVELQLRQVLETGEPIIDGEVIAETQAEPREKRHFLHNYHAIKSDRGDVVGVSCAIQDITQKKKAEEALSKAKEELDHRVQKRTEELVESNKNLLVEMANRKQAEENLLQSNNELQRILDSIPNYLWSAMIDSEGKFRYLYYSPVVEGITGRPPEFYLRGPKSWLSTVHPDDRACLQLALERIMSRQSMREEEEYRIILPDGSVRWVHDNVIVSPTENGCLRLDGVVGDITKRIQAEEALRASEEQIRLVLDSTAEAIYGLDLQGKCTFCNQACVDILGYKHSKEILNRNMHELIHHSHADGTIYPLSKCKIFDAFRRGEATHVDDEVLWKADGSNFPAEYRSFPIRHDGKLVGSVVTFLDITERKKVEEELRTQRAELSHAARLSTLGEMAAGLAHELNQPLTAMSAFAEGALVRLERGKLGESEMRSVFSRISEDAQRAGEIIRRLRNFVQKREAQRRKINLNNLVSDVCKFVESDAKHQNIIIEFNLEKNMPPVQVDPIEIQQVLLNLIRNAFDSIMQYGSKHRRIVISSWQKSFDRVEIFVEDSGPGISDGLAEQVFEPFYSSKSDGLGIGLGICQNIIEAHFGKIWLSNSSLGGAGFHFDLPAHRLDSENN